MRYRDIHFRLPNPPFPAEKRPALPFPFDWHEYEQARAVEGYPAHIAFANALRHARPARFDWQDVGKPLRPGTSDWTMVWEEARGSYRGLRYRLRIISDEDIRFDPDYRGSWTDLLEEAEQETSNSTRRPARHRRYLRLLSSAEQGRRQRSRKRTPGQRHELRHMPSRMRSRYERAIGIHHDYDGKHDHPYYTGRRDTSYESRYWVPEYTYAMFRGDDLRAGRARHLGHLHALTEMRRDEEGARDRARGETYHVGVEVDVTGPEGSQGSSSVWGMEVESFAAKADRAFLEETALEQLREATRLCLEDLRTKRRQAAGEAWARSETHEREADYI